MIPPPPRANPDLVGHQGAEATLAEAMRSGRLHHAWLITGPPGIGKATLAYRFARALLAGAPTLDLAPGHPTFKRVAAGTHADLHTVELAYNEKTRRMRTEIAVEDVRAIPDFLRLTPAEGGWRVVILDGAERVNRSSANALLKILEEPPARAVLVLVCDAPGSLLPTIRSRCRRLRLDPLPDDAVGALLARWLPDLPEEHRLRLVGLAEGSPGRALALAEGDGVALADLARDTLIRAPAITAEHAYAVADKLGRDEDAFATYMDLLRAGLAAAIRDAARGRADPDQARLLGARPLDAWVEVWHALTRLQDETQGAHLDRRQALVTGLTMLAQR